MCVLGGKEAPTAADVKAILSSVDAKVDDVALTKVISELSGKNLEDSELIAAGTKKLASI